MTGAAKWLTATPCRDGGEEDPSPSPAGGTPTERSVCPHRPTFPGSSTDVRAVLERAKGRPLPFTEVSAAIRQAAGRGDDPASERFGDVKAFRGLRDLRDRGLASRSQKGWILA